MVLGSVFGCLTPLVVIAGAMSVKDPFVVPQERREQSDAARQGFSGGHASDHVTMFNAFCGWLDAVHRGQERPFCDVNFLSRHSMGVIMNVRDQLLGLLYEQGFGHEMHDAHSRNLDMVRALICGGLYPNVAQHIHKRECRTKAQRVCFIHPTSVNYERKTFTNERFQFFVFGERVETSKVFLRCSTLINAWALILFGGLIHWVPELLPPGTPPPEVPMGTVEMDGWIKFRCSEYVAGLMMRVRSEIDALLVRKFIAPDQEAMPAHLLERLMDCIMDLTSHPSRPEGVGTINYEGYLDVIPMPVQQTRMPASVTPPIWVGSAPNNPMVSVGAPPGAPQVPPPGALPRAPMWGPVSGAGGGNAGILPTPGVAAPTPAPTTSSVWADTPKFAADMQGFTNGTGVSSNSQAWNSDSYGQQSAYDTQQQYSPQYGGDVFGQQQYGQYGSPPSYGTGYNQQWQH